MWREKLKELGNCCTDNQGEAPNPTHDDGVVTVFTDLRFLLLPFVRDLWYDDIKKGVACGKKAF